MARLPRIVVPDVPHHVVQRGNRRQCVFFEDADCRLYLELLDEWRSLDNVAILSYCLMPNHVHIIAVPSTEKSLTHFISEVHRRYSQAINRKKKWVGHLWQGRYSSFPLSEEHLCNALNYVERNPVKALLVASPEDWKWSSAHERTGESKFSIVDQAARRRFALSPQSAPGNPEDFASHSRTGRPMGSEGFIKRLEAVTGRDLMPKKVGRKPKVQKQVCVPDFWYRSARIYLDIYLPLGYASLCLRKARGGSTMSPVAKLFINGRSQAVRLPAAYRFDAKEVFIRKDQETGDVILSRKPTTWDGFFAALKGVDVPADFLDEKERNQGSQDRDPFEGCHE